MGSFEMSDLLSYYAEANSFTRIDRLLDEIEPVSTDIDAVVRLVQGLLIHEALASFYGAAFPERRVAEKQLHGANAILERAKRLNASSLRNVRPPEERVVGVCRHFTTLFVGVLRSKGIPSRVRCGFATYFERGKHVDHWVGEYWHTRDRRWVLVDAQLDDFQRKLFGVQIDSLDVPRDRFLVAGDAWKAVSVRRTAFLTAPPGGRTSSAHGKNTDDRGGAIGSLAGVGSERAVGARLRKAGRDQPEYAGRLALAAPPAGAG